ncbi:MAG: S-methyl-5'-thioinosine phosphorylase [Acidiferrobacterales bacterium]
MALIAIIGGSGLTNLKNMKITRREVIRTPYGEPSAPMVYGEIEGTEIAFLPRHGPRHTIPPHEINYRANIWALKNAGITRAIAIAAVGGISKNYQSPCSIAIPDQIIDYTYAREHTFFTGADKQVTHVDFTHPYCDELRLSLVKAATNIDLAVISKGTYGATQGPRFETAAEIQRMEIDGADVVGMTGMPEAGLARELGLCYAAIALVVNPAAGKSDSKITLKEIDQNLINGMSQVRRLLESAIAVCSK